MTAKKIAGQSRNRRNVMLKRLWGFAQDTASGIPILFVKLIQFFGALRDEIENCSDST